MSRVSLRDAADFAALGVAVAASRIGNRVALAQAMAQGLCVLETATASPAAAEIATLSVELKTASEEGASS